MKKAILILLCAVLFGTSCVHERELINQVTEVSAYDIRPAVKCKVSAGRIWVLFIPIGYGGRKYSTRRDKVQQKFLKKNKCDAISSGQIIDRKIIIPLILVNFSVHWTVLTAKPAIIKQKPAN